MSCGKVYWTVLLLVLTITPWTHEARSARLAFPGHGRALMRLDARLPFRNQSD